MFFETLYDMQRQFERGLTEKEKREPLWSVHFKLDEVLRVVERIRRAESCKIDGESVVRIAPLSYKSENCMQS
jgi:hypothetical protein